MRLSVRRSSVRMLAVFVAGVVVASGPQVAIAAFDAVNADKVDGRHAVGAAASVAERSGKLVATNADGFLPKNIIVKAPDADRLDGLNGAAYQRRVTGECSATKFMMSVEVNGSVTCGTDRINGGNAQMLDGLNSTAFVPQSARTIAVSGGGTALENGTALRNALLTVPTDATLDTPWLVTVGPGVYTLTAAGLSLPQYTTLLGAGRSTLITVEIPGTGFPAPTVVTLAKNAALRSVSIEHNLGGGAVMFPEGVRVVASDTRIDDVSISLNGPQATGVQVFSNAGKTTVTDSEVIVSGTQSADGILLGAGVHLSLRDSTIQASGMGMNSTRGVTVASGMDVPGTMDIVDTDIRAGGPTNVTALHSSGQTRVRGSSLSASGGATPYAVFQPGAMTNKVRLADSLVDGPATFDNGALITCVGAYNFDFLELDSQCQTVP